MKRSEASHRDSIEIASEVRVACSVFLMIELLVLAGALLVFAMPQSAFLQGILFAFVGVGVWNSTISALLFSIVAFNYPRIKTFLWTFILVAIAVAEWIVFCITISKLP